MSCLLYAQDSLASNLTLLICFNHQDLDCGSISLNLSYIARGHPQLVACMIAVTTTPWARPRTTFSVRTTTIVPYSPAWRRAKLTIPADAALPLLPLLISPPHPLLPACSGH